MNKTVKKLDQNVIKALTTVCENAKLQVNGFEWLTHTANYANFPASLVITCVFDNRQSIETAKLNQQDKILRKLIQTQLLKTGVLLKDVRRHVLFDSEEACDLEHNGNWNKRLAVN